MFIKPKLEPMKKHLKVVLLSCMISFVNIATAQTPVSDPDVSKACAQATPAWAHSFVCNC